MSLPADFFHLPADIETRWASPENPRGRKGAAAQSQNSRKGRPCFPLKQGEKVILAEAAEGSGMVRRIWLTFDQREPEFLRGLRIDIFWDGCVTPAVSAPLADFFGQGLGRNQVFESAFFSNPEGRSFNCVLPMPFRHGFRIVVTNEAPKDIPLFFYDVNYTLGDRVESPSYLHAHWRRENPTTLGRDFEVLPKITGRGRYLGANFSVIADRKTYIMSWWGEGECKIFLDGDGQHPTLAGTGTEDYIGTAWGQGKYAHLYQGCPIADWDNLQYSFYRYHVPDPVYFQRDIRVVFQQIGGAFGTDLHAMRNAGLQLTRAGDQAGTPVNMDLPDKEFALFERTDDWSSCCYFYLDRPENGLPALAPVEQRICGLVTEPAAKGTAEAV